MTSNNSEYDIAVGRILGAHALKGTVRVAPNTDVPDRHRTLKEVLVRTAKSAVLLKVEKTAPSSKGSWLMRFEGVATREGAEALAGGTMWIREEDLPELPEGRYYVHQIVGLRVLTVEGRDLGQISEVLVTGANDVYVTPGGLIPATAEVVKEIDLQAGTMLIQPLVGMLEEEPAPEPAVPEGEGDDHEDES
ncbi:MAG: ribosome maturation factor RimM [Armatimonadota bacterium]